MTTDLQEPTIAAIATPPGAAGIGIVRISGSAALTILETLFNPRSKTDKLLSHKFYYGWIIDSQSKRTVDEVLAVYMKAPHTYTREDVVEIHCHSNYLILQNILTLALSSGARLAEAGEFTKRAFLNGRIDLTRAEAVLELLESKTQKSIDLAVDQLQGNLYNQIEEIRQALIGIKAILEVAIDFPDDDVEILDSSNLSKQMTENIVLPLDQLLQSADRGKIYRDGISVVILGRPNVGKSSLLNALLQEERAIVTEIPGTTRDTIEEYIDIKGMPVRITDTAGIRASDETVEEIGIQRARQKMTVADLILLVIDSSENLTSEDIDLLSSITDRPAIIVANKTDLADADENQIFNHAPGKPIVPISAKKITGIKELENVIFSTVTGGSELQESDAVCVPNVRQQNALSKARKSCEFVLEGLSAGLPADLIAIDLQSSLDSLGDIVGQTTTEDVLDHIFSEFCIGK